MAPARLIAKNQIGRPWIDRGKTHPNQANWAFVVRFIATDRLSKYGDFDAGQFTLRLSHQGNSS